MLPTRLQEDPELFHERLDFILEENPGRACDDEVIRITD
jgi:hypothetical protein